jgi:excisionase family DNA binding protein
MARRKDRPAPSKVTDRTPYFTVYQVAELLGVHPQTVYRMIQNGELVAMRAGAQYRISKNAIRDWESSSTAASG